MFVLRFAFPSISTTICIPLILAATPDYKRLAHEQAMAAGDKKEGSKVVEVEAKAAPAESEGPSTPAATPVV